MDGVHRDAVTVGSLGLRRYAAPMPAAPLSPIIKFVCADCGVTVTRRRKAGHRPRYCCACRTKRRVCAAFRPEVDRVSRSD